MKKTIVLFAAILGLSLHSICAYAQDNPADDAQFGDERTAINFFGGVLVEPHLFNQELAMNMGATMGITYLDHFYFGGYYVALVTRNYREDIAYHYGEKLRASFNHGGFLLGYVWKPQSLNNLNFSLRAGWGSIWYFDPAITNADKLDELYRGTRDRIFALTPGVEYTVTPIPWIRIGLGVGYRVVFGLDRYNRADYDSPVATISLSFGSFKPANLEARDNNLNVD